MKYIADLHVHSSFSMATSSESNLDGFYSWAKIKGIGLIGTGDFTHPGWFSELEAKLAPDGSGFFELKEPPSNDGGAVQGIRTEDALVRFVLTCEISSIYKKHGKVHKVHSLIFAPSFDVARKINSKLEKIGNIGSDGRPILGLDPKILLEIVKSQSIEAELIPAHIWTPWFSVFGSNSGFNSIEECFEDLAPEIFALETGLSSDPSMNWRLSSLDRFALVSNSDAHSPSKLGREANVFETEMSYEGMFRALKTGPGFGGTYEFYPEEGKYHFDGHRKCGVCLDPAESRRIKGICPACGKKLTIGVMNRVLELADRPQAIKPGLAPGFRYMIPLLEILSEISGVGKGSKSVQAAYCKIVSAFGNEFAFLIDAPLEDVGARLGPQFREALYRMRNGKISPKPGYDGEFGTIRVFTDDELSEFAGQGSLFSKDTLVKKSRKSHEGGKASKGSAKKKEEAEIEAAILPDSDQERIKAHSYGPMLVAAGPGSGKTRSLVSWIERIISSGAGSGREILAITFTNRAKEELKARLEKSIATSSSDITVATFHGFAFDLIRLTHPEIVRVYGESDRRSLLCLLFPLLCDKDIASISRLLSDYFEGICTELTPDSVEKGRYYVETAKRMGCIDVSSLVFGVNRILKKDTAYLSELRGRYSFIAIDEMQDINAPQYGLLCRLFPPHESDDPRGNRALLAIGDPDQAIYGFRGSDVRLYHRFAEEYNPVRICLSKNYRSQEAIVRAAASVIAHNAGNYGSSSICEKGKLQAKHQAEREKIVIHSALNPEDESEFILKTIDEYAGGTRFESALQVEHCYSFSDIAVLGRTKNVLESVSRIFKRSSVPFSYRDNTSIASRFPFSAILSALSFLENGNDVLACIGVLRGVLGLRQKYDLLSLLPSEKGSPGFWERLASEKDFDLCDEDRERVASWSRMASELKSVLVNEGIVPCILRLEESFPSIDPASCGMSFQAESFMALSGEYGCDVKGFARRCCLDVHENEAPYNAEAVSLLTFHASKGLEFPIVFIAGAEDGVTPIISKGADMEEERRLFYVAMTRAKERLAISWSRKRLIFGSEKHMEESRFISEIPSELKVQRRERKAGKRSRDAGQPLLFDQL